MPEIRKVAVIGAGSMGSQIALQVAHSGKYEVALADAHPNQLARALAHNRMLVARSVERGRLDQPAADSALGRIQAHEDLAAAVSDADLVIEAVFEDLETKQEVFRQIDVAAPASAILASNSSTIAISRLAAVTGRPDRCCNLHFFHPVTVMTLCEVVRGPQTSDETVTAAMDFVRSIDRTPVLINQEIWGFVVNRILFAACEEAMHLLEGGYASAEDIDTAVKKGLNWPMGPFELMDFSGLDIFYGAIMDRHQLGDGPPARQVLKDKIEAGHLGRKSGRGFYDYSKSS